MNNGGMIQLAEFPAEKARVLPLRMTGDEQRVILLPFLHGTPEQLRQVLSYIEELDDKEASVIWKQVTRQFAYRHDDFEQRLLAHAERAMHQTGMQLTGGTRQLLAGCARRQTFLPLKPRPCSTPRSFPIPIRPACPWAACGSSCPCVRSAKDIFLLLSSIPD